MWEANKKNFIALLIGILGMFIAMGLLHLYQDHLIFHGMINDIIKQQQSRQMKNTQ